MSRSTWPALSDRPAMSRGSTSIPTCSSLRARTPEEAKADNVEFVTADASSFDGGPFSFIHARYLLSHVSEPDRVFARLKRLLAPGGRIAIEDIDMSGSFCHPPEPAQDRFQALYTEAVRRGGADANLGRDCRLLRLRPACGTRALEGLSAGFTLRPAQAYDGGHHATDWRVALALWAGDRGGDRHARPAIKRVRRRSLDAGRSPAHRPGLGNGLARASAARSGPRTRSLLRRIKRKCAHFPRICRLRPGIGQ